MSVSAVVVAAVAACGPDADDVAELYEKGDKNKVLEIIKSPDFTKKYVVDYAESFTFDDKKDNGRKKIFDFVVGDPAGMFSMPERVDFMNNIIWHPSDVVVGAHRLGDNFSGKADALNSLLSGHDYVKKESDLLECGSSCPGDYFLTRLKASSVRGKINEHAEIGIKGSGRKGIYGLRAQNLTALEGNQYKWQGVGEEHIFSKLEIANAYLDLLVRYNKHPYHNAAWILSVGVDVADLAAAQLLENCRENYTACKDNEQLMTLWRGSYSIWSSCEYAVREQYDSVHVSFGSDREGSRFYEDGDDAPKAGHIEVKIFYKTEYFKGRAYCVYDMGTEAVVSVKIK